MLLAELEKHLESLLLVKDFARNDNSMNGVQVGNLKADIKKVAFTVDASLLAFEQAVHAGADLLVVHHGLFWGDPLAVTGTHYSRLAYLIQNNLALYACHLPLDAHPLYGNNAGLAQRLGLVDIAPFGEYKGKMLGFKGRLPQALPLARVSERVGDPADQQIFAFGQSEVSTVGVVSGGAAFDVSQAIDEGLDLFITGESSHSVYHSVLEAGINMIAGGHYRTETLGVSRLMDYFTQELKLETCFLDIPTGL